MEPRCDCVVKNREDGETQREWFKRWMCMFHWMETDYYQNKLVTEPDGSLRLHLADTDTDPERLRPRSIHDYTFCNCEVCTEFRTRQNKGIP